MGSGPEIVQSFDPIPLYAVMESLGFEYHTERVGENEFHAYFYRTESKQDNGEIPMRPAALTNFPLIDEALGKSRDEIKALLMEKLGEKNPDVKV